MWRRWVEGRRRRALCSSSKRLPLFFSGILPPSPFPRRREGREQFHGCSAPRCSAIQTHAPPAPSPNGEWGHTARAFPTDSSPNFLPRHTLTTRAFVTFLTAGFPTADATVPLMLAMEKGGADIIELGVPFSDPSADGVVIQEANTVSCASVWGGSLREAGLASTWSASLAGILDPRSTSSMGAAQSGHIPLRCRVRPLLLLIPDRHRERRRLPQVYRVRPRGACQGPEGSCHLHG